MTKVQLPIGQGWYEKDRGYVRAVELKKEYREAGKAHLAAAKTLQRLRVAAQAAPNESERRDRTKELRVAEERIERIERQLKALEQEALGLQ